METLNTRDRYGNTNFNTGLGEVPAYLQYTKKPIQNCISSKRRVKQDLVTVPNVNGGKIFNVKINSNNWIDGQSLRLGFDFNLNAAPTTYGKFNDDCGINGILRSIKVNTGSGSKNLEYIYNYNLLQKIQYSTSISNDFKQSQGFLEGMGSFLNSTGGLSASNIINGPTLKTAIDLASANSYSISLWTGMLGQCGRLLPNNLLGIHFDLEFAPFLDFVVVDGGATNYQANNFYIVYDEYIVSDLYRQVFEDAVRTHGISFDYNTVTCSSVQVPALTTNISASINDSTKQLLSVYATIRPSDINTSAMRQAGSAEGAAAGAVALATNLEGTGLCTNLETIDGLKVISVQMKVGTTNYPEFPITKICDMYHMSLQSMNRANSLQLEMPLSYNKYCGAARCWWFGVDFELSKSNDNNAYSGINTSGHAIQLNVQLKNTTMSLIDAGCIYKVAPHATTTAMPITTLNTGGSNGGNANSFFLVDFFLLHSRILSISPSGGVVIDY